MLKRNIVGVVAALALAGGCSKHKEGERQPAAASGSSAAAPVADTGSAAGSGSAAADAPRPDPKLVERGAYLSNVLGCAFCHMPMGPTGPDFSRLYAGGMEVPEPFGTWRAPNITPHKGSGIGGWTDDQILASIREGVRPDGSQLYPIMPYLNYNRMTDDDGKALVAFLRTVPPIDNVVAPNTNLKLPQIPAPRPGNAPDPVDDLVKHGEYLVTLMHCNNCHAAAGKDGLPDFVGRPFSGGSVMEMPMLGTGQLHVPNITSDKETGIGSWTEEQIVASIQTMKRPDGTMIQGPMQLYLAGWSKLVPRDLQAIAAYVKQIPADRNKVPRSTFKPGVPTGAPPTEGAGSAAAGSAAAGSAHAGH